MDIGSGSYVGMRVLPSGAFASETEDEEIGSEEEEPINGPRGTSLVAITKKVSSTASIIPTNHSVVVTSRSSCCAGYGEMHSHRSDQDKQD